VRFGGSVIVRQRPGTAKSSLFVTLEGETGMAQAWSARTSCTSTAKSSSAPRPW